MIKQKALQIGENKQAASEAEWSFSKRPFNVPKCKGEKLKIKRKLSYSRSFAYTDSPLLDFEGKAFSDNN